MCICLWPVVSMLSPSMKWPHVTYSLEYWKADRVSNNTRQTIKTVIDFAKVSAYTVISMLLSYTKTEMQPFWWHCRNILYPRLSLGHLLVYRETQFSSKWWHFLSSVGKTHKEVHTYVHPTVTGCCQWQLGDHAGALIQYKDDISPV